MPPKKSPLKDGEDIKPDWINEQFDEHGGYDNLMGKSSTPGVAASMKKYMKKRGLKTSTATTNEQKWKVIVADCVESEMGHADPDNYKGVPPIRFWTRWDFIKSKLLDPVKVLHGSPFHFAAAVFLMYYGHQYSHELYTKPLPFHPISCSKYPAQLPCDVLKKVQTFTYQGVNDLYRVVCTFLIAWVIKIFTWSVVPFNTRTY